MSRTLTHAQVEVQLRQALAFTSDERLLTLTAPELEPLYRLPAGTVARLLAEAQQRRRQRLSGLGD